MAMTVAIPMTTPRIVRPERSLFARSWSTAINHPSRIECRAMLLRAQGFDRVEARGPMRGVDAEHDADAHAQAQRHRDRPGGDAGGERWCDLDQCCERGARLEPYHAAGRGQAGPLR